MRDYFRARIDWHTNGLMARTNARLPRDVLKVSGDVDKRWIVVTMVGGATFCWTGGEYGSRKVNGCYPPLMPKPADTHPMSYLPIPTDCPQVTVTDERSGATHLGFVHGGVIHDKSGVIAPEDIGTVYTIYCDGADVTSEFSL